MAFLFFFIMLLNVHFASVYKGGLFNILILKLRRYHSEILLFCKWFILYVLKALLHRNWVILYLRTCSNPIGPCSNYVKSLLICDWTIFYLWTTCTNVMRSFSASELASSWLGSFFSLVRKYSELSHSVSFAEYLSLFSFPFSFLLSGFCFMLGCD